MSKDIVYGYFKADTSSGPGYLCIRVDRPPKGVDGKCKATYAYCSPKDQFNRKIARRIADSRMNTARKNCAVSFVSRNTDAKSILDKAFFCAPDMPGWFRRANNKQNVSRLFKNRKREILHETLQKKR